MRLATLRNAGGADRLGALTSDGAAFVDFHAAAENRDDGAFRSMLALIEGGERALEIARRTADAAEHSGDWLVAKADVCLRAPLSIPARIRDFSVFPTHIVQSRQGM
jgi:hypothetical protein